MENRLVRLRNSAMLSTRAVALFALVIAVVLSSWRRRRPVYPSRRGSWVPGSTIEASLMGILEPVAGNGNIRLSVTGDGGSGRSVLILLESTAAETAPTLQQPGDICVASVAGSRRPTRHRAGRIRARRCRASGCGRLDGTRPLCVALQPAGLGRFSCARR